MLGKPKYHYGQDVTFEFNGTTLTGKIYIIDAYGTFFDDSDVSYDVMVDNSPLFNGQQALYKHIKETMLKEVK